MKASFLCLMGRGPFLGLRGPLAGLALLALALGSTTTALAEPLRLAFFEADATPPVGSPLAYDPMTWVDKPLSARGVAILGRDKPIVLCAVDWIGISNAAQDAWKQALAEAAETTTDRVEVHTLHQHDSPDCDFTANDLLAAHDLPGEAFDPVFARVAISRVAAALQAGLRSPSLVTHVGMGLAEVEQVASNRRIIGPDGKVAHTRYTSCTDPALRDAPAGTVDAFIRVLSFWDGEKALAALSYFATHPQSYYRTGGANPDFPGMAREMAETRMGGVKHVHFNGAGGNIGAGKWNDGSKENRVRLALRLAAGIERAWKETKKEAIDAEGLRWRTELVGLPFSHEVDLESLKKTLADPTATLLSRKEAASYLAWHQRSVTEGRKSQFSCLSLGSARLLHGPGELVVEYQLAAQRLAPSRFVCFAAYGDYGPGYICLTKHYDEGGYEASPRVSRVAPEVESAIMPALARLLAE